MINQNKTKKLIKKDRYKKKKINGFGVCKGAEPFKEKKSI